MGKTEIARSKAIKTKYKSKWTREDSAGWLFSSPVILGYLIFVIAPILVTFALSLTKYNLAGTPKFIGFDNYAYLFSGKDAYFFKAVKATFYYVFLSVPAGIVFSFLVAVLLNQKIKGRAFFRGAFYLPVVIPIAASSMIWMWLLQPDFGLLNHILKTLGLPPSQWLASETTVIPTLVLYSLWLTGNTIVIFLAGLQEVPAQLYEAIDVDGGNAVHKLLYITIPMTSSIIFFNTVIGFINAFQTFVQPYIMTSGGQNINMGAPSGASLLYVLNLYREAFRFSNYGNATAQAILLFIVIIIITGIFFKFSSSLVYYEEGAEKK